MEEEGTVLLVGGWREQLPRRGVKEHCELRGPPIPAALHNPQRLLLRSDGAGN